LECFSENKYYFVAKDRRIKRELDPNKLKKIDTPSGSIIDA
jgi:hypothetical protein